MNLKISKKKMNIQQKRNICFVQILRRRTKIDFLYNLQTEEYKKNMLQTDNMIVNRPGVAGAVLQIPLSLINYFF